MVVRPFIPAYIVGMMIHLVSPELTLFLPNWAMPLVNAIQKCHLLRKPEMSPRALTGAQPDRA